MLWWEAVFEYTLRIGMVSCLTLLVFGVLWAPIGGVVVHLLSRRRGPEAQISFGQGASASLLLFLPWLHLLLYSLGKAPGTRLIRASLSVLYLLWAIGPIGMWLSSLLYSVFLLDPGEVREGTRTQGQLSFFAFMFLAVNVVLVYLPSRRLLSSGARMLKAPAVEQFPVMAREQLSVFKFALLAFSLFPVSLLIYSVILLSARIMWQ